MNQTSVNLSVSDFNLERLSSAQFEEHLSASIAMGSNLAAFGRRGSGKTSIARDQIAAADHYEAYMNLSMYDKTDIAGFPEILSAREKEEKAERFVSYMLPKIFEPIINNDKPCVLFLDEIDKSERELWGSLLEIIQSRSINGRKLDNLKCSIMTGNLITEGGARPALPLLDRTEAYYIQASAPYWLRWAGTSNIHSSIFQFITDHPRTLQDEDESSDNYKGTSPRGWHLSSNMLYFGEQKGWSTELLNAKIAGQIGKKVGLDFKLYYQSYQVLLPLVSRIFANETYAEEYKGLKPTERLYVSTIVCSRLANILDSSSPENPPTEAIDNVARFLKIVSSENILASVKSQIRPARIVKFNLDEHKVFGPILSETQKRSE